MRKIEKNYPAKCVSREKSSYKTLVASQKHGRNLGSKLPLSAVKSGSAGE
jgi:hypothetical protein